jgi:hypothetical protein
MGYVEEELLPRVKVELIGNKMNCYIPPALIPVMREMSTAIGQEDKITFVDMTNAISNSEH